MALFPHCEVEKGHVHPAARGDVSHGTGDHFGIEGVGTDDQHRFGAVELLLDHLTAPVVPMPSRIWRARTRYMASTGASEMPSEAKIVPQSVRYWPTKPAMAKGIVLLLSEKMKISGKKKSFQTAIAVKMATIETAGRIIGRMTLKRMRSSPAPSIRAASSSSRGRVRMKLAKMKTAKGMRIAM